MADYTGSDYSNIAGSTMSGAATGFSIGGPVGGAIGGTIGFVGGLFGADAASAERELRAQMAENAAVAAGLQGEAREIQIILNRLSADRGRRQYAQRAAIAAEGVRAGEVISGMVGSSIARNARASAQQQLASNLQFSYLTQELGEQISQKMQEAAEAAVKPPEETPSWTEKAKGNVEDVFGGGNSGLGSIDTGSEVGDAVLSALDFGLGPVDEGIDKLGDWIGLW